MHTYSFSAGGGNENNFGNGLGSTKGNTACLLGPDSGGGGLVETEVPTFYSYLSADS